LKTKFANVVGLATGADVLIGGVHSGTVRSIELPHRATDQVTVTIQLDQSTHEIVRQDSVASIQTEGLLGNEFVAISFGSADKPETKDGDTIASVPPLEMSAILDKANGLLATGQQAMNNITQVTDHLNSISGKIDHGTGSAGALVNDRSLYNNLDATASSAKSTVSAAQAGIVDFQDNMQALKHNFLLRGYFKNRGYEDSSDLGKDEIVSLPSVTATKEFTVAGKQIFDKQDTAKLKNEKALKAAGEYLASNDFGVAVIEVSTGPSGSSEDSLTLSQGRALVVRDYIVQHYGFDDTKLKTIAVGKQQEANSSVKPKDDWGQVRILIYPPDTPMPAVKTPSAATKSSNSAPQKQ
jgi:phospholipid/cholesterol/gamma-HCH transport system substrate-binding protein